MAFFKFSKDGDVTTNVFKQLFSTAPRTPNTTTPFQTHFGPSFQNCVFITEKLLLGFF